jgi:hypothetical protein
LIDLILDAPIAMMWIQLLYFQRFEALLHAFGRIACRTDTRT